MEKVIQLTDPATELAELIQRLRPSGKRNSSGFAAVSNIMKVDPTDTIFFDLLAIARQRIDFVEKTIPEFTELDPQLATEAKAATRACVEMLSFTRLANVWDPAAQIVSEKNINSLQWLGNLVMRKHYPRSIVPPDQREEVLGKVTEELKALRGGGDFGWQRTALIEGLEKIERVLVYFPYFGHDAATKEFFAVDLAFRTIYEQEPRGAENASTVQKIFNALVIVNTLTTLYVMPDQIATANDRYRNWMPKVVTSLSAPSPPDQKLLPPPVAVLPEQPKINEASDRAAE